MRRTRGGEWPSYIISKTDHFVQRRFSPFIFKTVQFILKMMIFENPNNPQLPSRRLGFTDSNPRHRNVFMCFKAWLAWTRVKTDKRREKLEELKRRLKMEECLATAVKISENEQSRVLGDSFL